MIEQARYRTSPIEEFRGNPLIEALPPPRVDEEIYDKLYRFPKWNDEERNQPAHIRKLLTSRLDKIIIPRPEYFELFHNLEEAIFRGYENKKPNSATTNHWLHFPAHEDTPVSPLSGVFQGNARVITVFGPSGVGKSKMLDQVLPLFPRCIKHPPESRASLSIEQLVYIKVECPEKASISALCRAILRQYEQDTGDTPPSLGKRPSNDDLEDAVDKVVRSSFLGVMAIDELTNISIQKAGGKRQFLQFLLRLMNKTGVPFVFVGTEELPGILSMVQWTGRRCESGTVMHMPPMTKALWNLFISRIWKFQWTNVPTELTTELSGQLAELSKGLPDPAIRTFREAQKRVIGTGDERITASVLREAFHRAAQLSKNHLATLPSVDTPKSRTPAEPAEDHSDHLAAEVDCSTTKVIPDVQRIQHLEFEGAIKAALAGTTMLSADFDQNMYRDARGQRSPMAFLADSGVLIEDPVHFATEFDTSEAERQ